MTTLVQIDEARHEVFVGDMLRQSLTVLRADGTVITEVPVGNAPVAVRRQSDALWVTAIGSILPSDVPSGEVVVLRRSGDTYRFYPGDRKLHRLQRPAATRYDDLNEDGIEDLIVSEYGNQLGQLAWYEGRADGTYQVHVLSHDPGSMASEVRDLNGDGWKDVAAIFGQNREGVQFFYNLGDGRFQPSGVLQLPPCYGISHFQFFDFNADGHPDILATNGDNGDYPPVRKPYHGVRIWRNDGHHRFTEQFFFPMHGAFKALAGDFDGDEDADIVAIAMFPDFEHHPEEGFVYLENQGDLRFEAATLPEAATGRWLTMDAGNLDGDGDLDVVLGSFIQGPGAVPEALAAQWRTLQRPILYLENQTR